MTEQVLGKSGASRRHPVRKPAFWLGVLVLLLTLVALFAQGSAGSESDPACPYGAISAIGPVDAEGHGDTTPDVACITP
jgi:hypothetical protein